MSETAATGFIGGFVLSKDRTRCDSWHCTAIFPWAEGCHVSGQHPEAQEVDWYDDGDDCIAIYQCPNCGKQFSQVIPR